MDTTRRIAPIAAAAMAALTATLAAGCGTAAPATTATPVTTAASVPAATTATPAAAPAAGTTIRVSYAAGQVTGDTGKVAVPLGGTVDLVVSSDVAGEVHLHGYDRSIDVPAGGTATLTFTADIPGGFGAELENVGQKLVELQVS